MTQTWEPDRLANGIAADPARFDSGSPLSEPARRGGLSVGRRPADVRARLLL